MGETNYNLKDAQELRIKLTKLAESVDSIRSVLKTSKVIFFILNHLFINSRKIASLGTQDDPPPHPKQLQLQNTIRLSITQFLRQIMLGLPTLPTAEELKKLQDQRRIEIQKRIQQEKQIALDEQIRYNSSPQRRTANYNNNYSETNNESAVVSPDAGWGPEFMLKKADNSDQIEDPMLQQINIIRNYIKQAREAHKYDEMHMLEENLKELEIEYFIQEHGNQVSS